MSENLNLNLKICNEHAKCPKYAYVGDAGFDLCSVDETELAPGERQMIHCGFSIAIPEGYCGLVIPRSGLAAKHGITVVNAPGLIDSGYRGEICVILLNTDKSKSLKINIGDRIAQMVISPYAKVDFSIVDELDNTDRAEGRLGSSGIK
ncbi:MAG: dUTP diphosphatase [Coriobacteriia bacterium]|nr:dUTP diphosphatase [Coriobacteriia bacterium]